MSDETTPYREAPADPVCAVCKHRCDAQIMDAQEPWRDWLCQATPILVWPEEYNPLTGIRTPAKMGIEKCLRVNGDGKCTKFELKPPRTTVAPQIEPETTEPAPDEEAQEPAPSWRGRARSWIRSR